MKNDVLVQGILDRLSKQADYGGLKSQPKSADDMSKLIVEYCIGSYERSPESEEQRASTHSDSLNNHKKQRLSISQIYSNYLNRIVPNISLSIWSVCDN